MANLNQNSLDCYALNEDPMTCGVCGARTSFDELIDGSQVHQCLNANCDYRFAAVEDKDWPAMLAEPDY